MKSAVFAPLALTWGALALASCESKQEPAAIAAEKAPEGITASDARLVLPAVKGNPGAVYFTLHNDSASDATIESVAVDGAQSAMMHQTTMANGMSEMHAMSKTAVPADGKLAFEPGGMHVMAMDLADTLAKGATTEVTLTFASGNKAVFPAEILAAGDAR